MSEAGLSADLIAFASEHIGPIENMQRASSGSSRITWLLEGKERRAVLRVDPGDGPMADTAFSLSREKTVYELLSGMGVKSPQLYASTSNALLLEWADGGVDLPVGNPEKRSAIIGEYVDALAELHSVPFSDTWSRLNPPSNAAEAAAHNVGEWVSLYRTRVQRPNALATIASRWLVQNAPRDVASIGFCHGDVGPGNFMFAEDKITAMIDWEFAHIGDPMGDLAWLAFRGHHFQGDLGDFDNQVLRWEKQTGVRADRRRIAYYRILVMYIFLVSSLAALDNGGKSHNRFIWLGIVPLMDVLIPKAIFDFAGEIVPTVAPNALAGEGAVNEISEHLAALADLIRISSPQSPDVVQGAALGVVQLNQVLRPIITENIAATSSYVGRNLDASSWVADFDRWVTDHPKQDMDSLAQIYANGVRRMQPEPYKAIADRELMDLKQGG